MIIFQALDAAIGVSAGDAMKTLGPALLSPSSRGAHMARDEGVSGASGVEAREVTGFPRHVCFRATAERLGWAQSRLTLSIGSQCWV